MFKFNLLLYIGRGEEKESYVILLIIHVTHLPFLLIFVFVV